MLSLTNQVTRSLTTTLKYGYLPISNYYVGNKPNPKLNARFNVGG